MHETSNADWWDVREVVVDASQEFLLCVKRFVANQTTANFDLRLFDSVNLTYCSQATSGFIAGKKAPNLAQPYLPYSRTRIIDTSVIEKPLNYRISWAP